MYKRDDKGPVRQGKDYEILCLPVKDEEKSLTQSIYLAFMSAMTD